jgi:hypothetical protein
MFISPDHYNEFPLHDITRAYSKLEPIYAQYYYLFNLLKPSGNFTYDQV